MSEPTIEDYAQGQRLRITHEIELLRGCLESLEIAVRVSRSAPIGLDAAHALLDNAGRLATTVAKLDAYQRAADVAKRGTDG